MEPGLLSKIDVDDRRERERETEREREIERAGSIVGEGGRKKDG